MTIELDVQYAVDCPDLPPTSQLEHWVTAALQCRQVMWQRDQPWQAPAAFHQAAQLTLRLVSAQESAELNEVYRGRSGPTNVLSFPCAVPHLAQPPLLGDIIICADCVAEEARQQARPVQMHWAHLVIHGVLHLLGYDHIDQDQALSMETLETQIMLALGFGDPYVENGEY